MFRTIVFACTLAMAGLCFGQQPEKQDAPEWKKPYVSGDHVIRIVDASIREVEFINKATGQPSKHIGLAIRIEVDFAEKGKVFASSEPKDVLPSLINDQGKRMPQPLVSVNSRVAGDTRSRLPSTKAPCVDTFFYKTPTDDSKYYDLEIRSSRYGSRVPENIKFRIPASDIVKPK